MTTDDLLTARAKSGSITYHPVLRTYLDHAEVLPVYEQRLLHDLVLSGRLTVRDDGLVTPAEQAEVA